LLRRLLNQHPDIQMAQPERPEPKYFLAEPTSETWMSDYMHKHFEPRANACVFGEKSTSYCEREDVAERLSRLFPGARIIFLLRDPAARAISNFEFSVRNGFEHLPMDEAFRQEDQRLGSYDKAKVSTSPFGYLARGDYLRFIQAYERHFPPEHIHLIILERLLSQRNLIASVFRFLSVDTRFSPTWPAERVNSCGHQPAARKASLDFLCEHFDVLNQQLRRYIDDPIPEWQY
jgi:hypothetical protein